MWGLSRSVINSGAEFKAVFLGQDDVCKKPSNVVALVSKKWSSPHDHLIKQNAKGPEISGLVVTRIQQDFWAHILGGATQCQR